MGLELASSSSSRPVHRKSYPVLNSDRAAVQVVDFNNVELSIRTINKSPATTETFHQDPALPDILTYEILSSSLERRAPDPSDLLNPCSIVQ